MSIQTKSLFHVVLFVATSCSLLLHPTGFAMAQNSSDMSNDMTTTTTTLGMNATMAPSSAPTYLGGISPECANETDMLANDANLTNALETLFQGYRDEFKDKCPFELTNAECDLTFGSEGNITYNVLCEELGGQIYEHSVTLTCGLEPLSVDFDLGVVPECISSQCNVSAIDMGMLTNPNITNFASSLDNGGCQGKVESKATSLHICNNLLSLFVSSLAAGTGLLLGMNLF